MRVHPNKKSEFLPKDCQMIKFLSFQRDKNDLSKRKKEREKELPHL
jgi:hypothetical protein